MHWAKRVWEVESQYRVWEEQSLRQQVGYVGLGAEEGGMEDRTLASLFRIREEQRKGQDQVGGQRGSSVPEEGTQFRLVQRQHQRAQDAH
jgi:hypothetical protein